MDIEEIVIRIISQWASDCFDCARSLARETKKEKHNTYVKICDGYNFKTFDGMTKNDILLYLRTHTIKVCFTDLTYLVELIKNIEIEDYKNFIDLIWKECNTIYPCWSLYFDEYRERLYDLL